MGFVTYQKFVSAYNDGQARFAAFRKTPNAAFVTVSGTWADLSGTAGQPKPNYFAATPLQPTLLDGLDGIYHGQNVSPQTKHLHRLGMYSATAGVIPSWWYLCDYLMYYPFIDMDAAGEVQTMIIPASPVSLPRYANGAGVKMMLVAQAPYTGGQTFNITYIDGNDATITISNINTNTAAITGSLVSSGIFASCYGPFLPDVGTGVKSVVSITFNGANGGLAAIVLVKPLWNIYLREATAAAEVESTTLMAGMPRIYDGAYLNFIGSAAGSFASSVIGGYAEFVWGN